MGGDGASGTGELARADRLLFVVFIVVVVATVVAAASMNDSTARVRRAVGLLHLRQAPGRAYVHRGYKPVIDGNEVKSSHPLVPTRCHQPPMQWRPQHVLPRAANHNSQDTLPARAHTLDSDTVSAADRCAITCLAACALSGP